MSSKTRLSLLQIEQEVETQAKEWQRQRLQSRLQQLADEQGAVCPDTGEALQEAQASAWVEPLLHQLKHGQEADVSNTLEALPAQRQAAGLSLCDLLQREIAYFHTASTCITRTWRPKAAPSGPAPWNQPAANFRPA